MANLFHFFPVSVFLCGFIQSFNKEFRMILALESDVSCSDLAGGACAPFFTEVKGAALQRREKEQKMGEKKKRIENGRKEWKGGEKTLVK